MARLERDPPQTESDFANRGEVAASDRPVLASATGRSPGAGDNAPEGSVEADEIREKSVGTSPVSDRTDFRLSGTGAIETDDGLDEMSEVVREQAEDIDNDQPEEPDSMPVFDRGEHI